MNVVQQSFTQILITSLTTHLKTFTKAKPLCFAWLKVYLLDFQEPFLGKRCVLAFFFPHFYYDNPNLIQSSVFVLIGKLQK